MGSLNCTLHFQLFELFERIPSTHWCTFFYNSRPCETLSSLIIEPSVAFLINWNQTHWTVLQRCSADGSWVHKDSSEGAAHRLLDLDAVYRLLADIRAKCGGSTLHKVSIPFPAPHPPPSPLTSKTFQHFNISTFQYFNISTFKFLNISAC